MSSQVNVIGVGFFCVVVDESDEVRNGISDLGGHWAEKVQSVPADWCFINVACRPVFE